VYRNWCVSDAITRLEIQSITRKVCKGVNVSVMVFAESKTLAEFCDEACRCSQSVALESELCGFLLLPGV